MRTYAARARSLVSKSCLLIASIAVLGAGVTGCRSSATSSADAASARQALAVLGTSNHFAVLAGQAVTNTGSSVLLGDVGVNPGTAVTGFPPGLVVGGTIHSADAVSLQAQADNTAGYGVLAGQLCTQDMTGTDLGGLTLTAGTYCFSSSAQLTGTLTLDAAGDPNAAFVFQIGSTLTTASNSSVALINGAQTCNVYWQVGSSATVGTTSTFVGNILALTSITLTTGATVVGRALAQNGAVTLDSNIITLSICTKELDGGTAGGASSCDGTVCDCGCVDTDTDALGGADLHSWVMWSAVPGHAVPVRWFVHRPDDRRQQLRRVWKRLRSGCGLQRWLLRSLPRAGLRELVCGRRHGPQPLRGVRQQVLGERDLHRRRVPTLRWSSLRKRLRGCNDGSGELRSLRYGVLFH